MSDSKDWTFEISSENNIVIDTGSEYTNNVTMNNIDYIDTSTISSYATDTISTTTLTSSGGYTISNTGYTFSDSDGNIVINTRDPVDFEDCMPILEKIQSMCKEYPGLDKAFDNFKMTYKMVHQDWIGKQKKK